MAVRTDVRDRTRWVAAVEEVRYSLDPRDNISVDYSPTLNSYTVLVGQAMVFQSEDRVEALGYARRLVDGCEEE